MDQDLLAEFRLTSSSLPLVDLAASIPNARVQLDELVGDDHGVLLCWIQFDSPESVEAALDAAASIAGWSLLNTAGDRRLYRLRMTDSVEVRPPIFEAFIERGVTPIHATILDDGCIMRARFPDRSTFAEYREACDDRGMTFTLEGLYRPAEGSEDVGLSLAGLTSKQREAVLLAHEEGYYDVPRKTNLADLSDRLDISERSLSDRLRRAERELVATAITNERLTRRNYSSNSR